jgi:hypothetical protein
MDDQLLGYLLNALEPDEQRTVSRYVQQQAGARTHLDRLRQALAPLADDRDDSEPPCGLAERTLARIRKAPPQLPRAPVTRASRAPAFRWSGWRWADAAVAASVLLVAAGLLLSLRSKLMFVNNLRACESNQKEFWFALQRYRDQDRNRHGFPNVADEPAPLNVAGITVPILIQAGVLDPARFSVTCPTRGSRRPCRWSLDELRRMPPEEFDCWAPELMGSYAYSLGFRGGDRLFGPRTDDPYVPILADRPPLDALPGNSPNHEGYGQNVLLVNGQVRYSTTRTLGGDDDIYSNRSHEVRAGLDAGDTVLGFSSARP